MSPWIWGVVLLVVCGSLAALTYWHLIIAEGAYLGTRLVAYLYDRFAHRYDDIKGFDWEDEHDFIARPLRLSFDLAGVEKPLILDVGTGTGRVPRVLLDRGAFSGHIVALDRSLGMLQEAVRRLGSAASVSWLWQDASRLPFSDATFDAVCCLEVLEFTPDPRRTLEEMIRVLRPGGFLLLSNRIGWQAHLLPGRTFRRSEFHQVLLDLGIAVCQVRPWQVDYDWALARKAGVGPGKGQGHRSLAEILHCPGCGALAWETRAAAWRCETCGRKYPYRDGILMLVES
ncbi:MAG TPA: methyltransferase domain-containing protein [Caldilineae bacterium]|nr:methyltransferase domain-containing protein [Caldilineae bacterium]